MRTSLGWAPEIPDHWEVVPLNAVAKMGTGHTPDRLKPEYWENCTIPWVTLTDASHHGESIAPIMDTYQHISELGVRNSSATVHPSGTVFLSRTASVGHSAIMGVPMATTQDFATWTCGPRIAPEYLLFVLRAMRPEWERLAYGSTHKTIYMPDIEALRVPLPPIDEQRALVAYLVGQCHQIDALRSHVANQAALNAERSLEAIREECTVGSPTGRVQDTGVPWMPKMRSDSILFKIGRTFSLGGGTTPRTDTPHYYGGPHPWINTADLRDAEVTSASRSVSDEALQDFPSLQLHPSGVLVVAMYGSGTIGRIGLTRIAACTNQACCVLAPRGAVLATYLFFWFLSHRAGVIDLGYGGGQTNISQQLIRSLRFPASPKIEQQQRSVDRCRAIKDLADGQSSLLQRRGELLSERRQALVSLGVVGQVGIAATRGVA